MGTNYYWNPELSEETADMDAPAFHIGKMSAAGKYCCICGITQSGHTTYVHDRFRKDPTDQCIIDTRRLHDDYCPNCKQPWGQVSSFTFTMMCHLATVSNFYNLEIAIRNQDPTKIPIYVIIDEYGNRYTAVEFLDNIVKSCPIVYQDYGRWS